MRKIKILCILLFCSFMLFGCNDNEFYEQYDVINKKELNIEDLETKTSDISTIIKNISTINGEEYICNIFEEKSFVKSYVPITQRSMTTFVYDENKLKESCKMHLFSPDYDYFEENIINSYIESLDDETIYYIEAKNIFENNFIENNTKNVVDRKEDLSTMFPLYYLFIIEQYEKNNTNIIQLNDCNINGVSYYHLQFSTKDYDDIILGVDSYIYDLSNSIYNCYINKDTFVVDYILFSTLDNSQKNYYCLIEYEKLNSSINIPEYLLSLPNEEIE